MATTSSLRSFDSTVMSSSTPVQSPHKIKRGVSARTLVSPQGSRHKLRSSFTKGVLVGCTGLLVYGLILMKFAAPYVSIKWKDASGPSHTELGGARDSAVGQTPRPFTSDMSYATMAAQADKLSNTFVSKPPSDDPATAATTVEPTTIDAMTKPADSGERSGSDGLNKAQAGNENEINTEKATKQWDQLDRGELIDTIALVLAKPPPVDANPQCHPPELEEPTCTELGFSGKRPADQVATVWRVMPFGFEADTLEIALREVQGLHVKVILIESALTHKQPFQHKVSQWDRIKTQSRFDGIRDLVAYRTTMPADFIARFANDAMWASERAQERYGLDAAKVHLGDQMKPTDILVMGSPDEIMSRRTMHSLSHCVLAEPMVGAAIGFPYGYIERAFEPDFKSLGLRYSFTLPTAYSLGRFPYEKIIRYFDPPNKNRLALQGGMHLTGYTLLAAMLIKDVSTTDHSGSTDRIDQLCRNGAASLRQAARERYATPGMPRTADVATLNEREKKSYVTPWFLECNPRRYPSWFKDAAEPDKRDDDLQRALCPA